MPTMRGEMSMLATRITVLSSNRPRADVSLQIVKQMSLKWVHLHEKN